MKHLLLPAAALCLSTSLLLARGGGGGFREGGFGEGGFREGPMEGERAFDPAVDADRVGEDRVVDDGVRLDGDDRPVDASVTRTEDGAANVNVRTINGKDYDATVVGPDGFRAGYVWRDGGYVAVDCDPFVPYVAPFGAFAGWSIVTQPDYIQYPVYTTYPVETAVELALQKLGLYEGPIDGLAASCAGAIEQYQTQNNMDPTGTITPDLLTALGIQATFE
ncbi:MAG: hypothetical protein IAE97_11830 [Chthoniobacterales bacterium]|nr:hypothetical protein [Chthoniobacterales bacterium]